MGYKKLNKKLKEKFKRCKLFVLDFDGVFTDDKVYVDQDGHEMVRCDRSDGLGLSMLRDSKRVEIFIISKEANKVVTARANKLRIGCFQGIDDKIALLTKEIQARNLQPDQVCYMGNDITDIACMKFVGLAIAVPNSHKSVFSVADYTTRMMGGGGAIREVCEIFINL